MLIGLVALLPSGLHLVMMFSWEIIYSHGQLNGNILSRSSAEAGYRGVANVVAETAWHRNLLRELHTPLLSATLVYYDNFSVIYMTMNPVQHQRTKHIKIDIHFLRDMVGRVHVHVLHVPSRYYQQKRFTKTHLAVHCIKQREGESVKAFATRYTDDTLKILGLHEDHRIFSFVHGLRTRNLVEHLSIDLPSTYKGLMEKTYTWIEAREVSTYGALNDRMDNFERSRKSSWDNGRGQKSRDRFFPYQGPNHRLLSSYLKVQERFLPQKSFENHPSMLNKDNYVPWSSRIIRYARSRPNGKMIVESIENRPYVRRMIATPGEPDLPVPVLKSFH
nr:NBS-containing resistance-like protein [Tanacetum cinerariifolium]GEW59719.1 NBS-containing resistance-like protein [Tanacetum cinerariifolium]